MDTLKEAQDIWAESLLSDNEFCDAVAVLREGHRVPGTLSPAAAGQSVAAAPQGIVVRPHGNMVLGCLVLSLRILQYFDIFAISHVIIIYIHNNIVIYCGFWLLLL